jgi:acetylornithine deacetylase
VSTRFEDKVLSLIDSRGDEIVGFLQKLVRFPSVTGDELGIQQFVASTLKEMGLSVDLWEPDHEELKRHPVYVAVDQGYKNRPN